MEAVKQGDLYYLSAQRLGLPGLPNNQMFKVQVHLIKDNKNILVNVKHYKTTLCNKVTLSLTLPILLNEGIKYGN